MKRKREIEREERRRTGGGVGETWRERERKCGEEAEIDRGVTLSESETEKGSATE